MGAHLPRAFFARWGSAWIWVRICPFGSAQISSVAVVAVSTSTFLPVRLASADAATSSFGPVDACLASVRGESGALGELVVVGVPGCHQGRSTAVSAASTRPRVSVSRVRVRTNGLRRRGGAGTAVYSRGTRGIFGQHRRPRRTVRGAQGAHTITRAARGVHI